MDGLKVGDSVVADGMQRVRPGVEVNAVPFNPGVPAPPAQAPRT